MKKTHVLTLEEQIQILKTPMSEQSVELVMKALPGLTRQEALTRIEHSRSIRAKIVRSGRCPECGDIKHETKTCPLKEQGDRESIKALKERYAKTKA